MMAWQPVFLWSDLLIWLLVAVALGFAGAVRRSPPLLTAWRRVGGSRPGMAAVTVLRVFLAVGLVDSLHYRPQLEGKPGEPVRYGVEVLSALDALVSDLRTHNEKTYSAPLATRAFAKA